MRQIFILALIPVLAGCAPVRTPSGVAVLDVALANLVRADGSSAGVATIAQRSDGLWLSISANAPRPGSFGMHLHDVGKCDGPGFATAGPHWNPAKKQHGRDNPMGSHAGDLPNLKAGADTKLIIETRLVGVALSGDGGLLDADGAALVIHETADDYRTDPSGNSGQRIICGVFLKT